MSDLSLLVGLISEPSLAIASASYSMQLPFRLELAQASIAGTTGRLPGRILSPGDAQVPGDAVEPSDAGAGRGVL